MTRFFVGLIVVAFLTCCVRSVQRADTPPPGTLKTQDDNKTQQLKLIQDFKTAIGSLQRSAIYLPSPIYVFGTNRVGNWEFHFVNPSEGENEKGSMALVSTGPNRESKLASKNALVHSNFRALNDGIGQAFERSVTDLDRKLGIDSFVTFTVTVGLSKENENEWLFVYRFPPYRLHTGVSVVVKENGTVILGSRGI